MRSVYAGRSKRTRRRSDQYLWMALGGVAWRRRSLPGMTCKTNGIDQEPALARCFGKERITRAGTNSDVLLAGGGDSLLDDIVRDGARQMLAAALRLRPPPTFEEHAHECDDRAGAGW